MKFGVVLKPFGKWLKDHNCNIVSRIKNGNSFRALITPIDRQQPPPQRNDMVVFSCFNCEKISHMIKKCKTGLKPCVAHNAQVNMTDE